MLARLSDLSPQERHSLLTPLITPRPIAFVSTAGRGGGSNVAPFSFFAMGGQSPQSVAFCPVADRNGNPKDTLRNIKETGEFVINIVTRSMAERVNQASAPYPHGVDEFDKVGFTKAPSIAVKPSRVGHWPLGPCRRARSNSAV